MLTFQQIILTLQDYWDKQGCALLQPIDMEVGAGTSHTGTFLRALGPRNLGVRLMCSLHAARKMVAMAKPESLAALLPIPSRIETCPRKYFGPLPRLIESIGSRSATKRYSLRRRRLGKPTLGAWGLGWEVWLNGMEVTQFTYFQQVGGIDCKPILGEITYGIERLAMYLQGVENVYDLVWTEREENGKTVRLTYGDVYHQNEVEQSTFNFEYSNTDFLFSLFTNYEAEAKRLLEVTEKSLALPAYEMILKAAHTFNLFDARGAISVTERAAYIGRIRNFVSCGRLRLSVSTSSIGLPNVRGRRSA